MQINLAFQGLKSYEEMNEVLEYADPELDLYDYYKYAHHQMCE